MLLVVLDSNLQIVRDYHFALFLVTIAILVNLASRFGSLQTQITTLKQFFYLPNLKLSNRMFGDPNKLLNCFLVWVGFMLTISSAVRKLFKVLRIVSNRRMISKSVTIEMVWFQQIVRIIYQLVEILFV